MLSLSRPLRLVGLFTLLSLSPPPTAQAYYGRRSIEAQLTFQAQVDAPFSTRATLPDLRRDGSARRTALERVDEQIQHLMGTFQSPSFIDDFGHPGVLGEQYSIRFLSISDGSAPGRRLIRYAFSGKVVFGKSAFRGTAVRNVPIRMPLSPDEVYALGVVRGINRCTDAHYNDESDFWYFWDPEMHGCPLAGGHPSVFTTTGALQPIPNTRLSYPEFDRLYGPNGNGSLTDIWVFFGYINDITDLRRANRRDDAVRAFRHVETDLRDRGFKTMVARDAFREYSDGRRVQGINYLRTLEKTQRILGQDVTVRVNVLLTDTDVASRDGTFHRYLIPALETGDIVVYDGHSGLGGNLDLANLPRVEFKRGKYQIFYFNGCSSYPYFNGTFFSAKGGSRNLDVVTSGLPTYSDSAGPNVAAFLDRFVDGELRSWQKILSELEESNGENGTYLTGVNGDEDNLWVPRSR